MIRIALLCILAVLAGCAADSSKQTCEAYQYCCSWRCTTPEEREALGPDPCDCVSDSSDTGEPGECVAVEDECSFIVLQ